MSDRAEHWVLVFAAAVFGAAGAAALVLNFRFGETIFVERLITGLAGCL